MKLYFNFALRICYGYSQRFRTASNPKLPSVHHNYQFNYRCHKCISISIAIYWHDQFIHMGTSQVCVHKINDMLNGDEVQYGIKKGFSFFLIAYSSNFKLQCNPNSISTNKWKRKAKTVIFIIHINTFCFKSASFTFLCVFCINDNFKYQN